MEFARCVGKLIEFVYSQPGWGVTFGEAWRTDEMAELYARAGKGISNSNHRRRLAIDLNLFINGVYQRDTLAYRPLGEYWKSLSSLGFECVWGGDFKLPTPLDGNHFSVLHLGVR